MHLCAWIVSILCVKIHLFHSSLSLSLSLTLSHTQIPIRRKELTKMSSIIGHHNHHFITEPSQPNITVLYEIQCELHILTTFVIPDILLFLSFAYGLYIFRWKQTEQLSTLTETVGTIFFIECRLEILQF